MPNRSRHITSAGRSEIHHNLRWRHRKTASPTVENCNRLLAPACCCFIAQQTGRKTQQFQLQWYFRKGQQWRKTVVVRVVLTGWWEAGQCPWQRFIVTCSVYASKIRIVDINSMTNTKQKTITQRVFALIISVRRISKEAIKNSSFCTVYSKEKHCLLT